MSEIVDKKFLEGLRQKLKTGNRRSIHLNVLPGRLTTRLELCSLNEVKPNLAQDFIQTLLEKSKFNFEISFKDTHFNEMSPSKRQRIGLISKRLNSISFENTDNYLEHGVKTFGFGFPVLIKWDRNDPTKCIKAPLLIWSLDIECSKTGVNSWTIKREDDFPVLVNEVLISYLEADEGIKIEKLSEQQLEDSIIDRRELYEICDKILGQIGSKVKTQSILYSNIFEELPDNKTLNEENGSVPRLVNSGVFGLYRSQKESIIRNFDYLITNHELFSKDESGHEKFHGTNVSSVETDPSQQEILNSLSSHPNKIIQGPPGTGKSQTLTALISNALANHFKCLVVCEKKTALDVIYNNLKRIGLQEQCVIIEDAVKDRSQVVDSVRNRLQGNLGRASLLDDLGSHSNDYKICLENVENNIRAIQQGHSKLSQNLFGGRQWTRLVGEYLQLNHARNNNPLNKVLVDNDFNFTQEELNAICRILQETEQRFTQVCSLDRPLGHTLEFFKDDFFLNPSLNETLSKLKNEIETLINDPESLPDIWQKVFKSTYKYYHGFVTNSSLLGFLQTCKVYLKLLPHRKSKSKFVQSLTPSMRALLKIPADLGFKKVRTLFESKDSILRNYEKLKHIFDKNHMGYDFLEDVKKQSLSDIYSNVHELLLNYLRLLQSSFQDFNTLYRWKTFYLTLEPRYQKLVIQFILCRQSNWQKLFKHWYYQRLLNRHEDNLIPDDDAKVHDLMRELGKSSHLQIRNTISYWKSKQKESVRRFDTRAGGFAVKTLYNKKGSKGNKRNSLRKIIEVDAQLFTDFFPVLLVNPSVCCSLLPLKKGMFDMVIFDEASQLRLEDTFPALLRGKSKIVSGDSQQMPPSSYFSGHEITFEEEDEELSEEVDEQKVADQQIRQQGRVALVGSESLLEFAENRGYKESFLQIHYRSRHPYLIDFSNAAFYENRLQPMPARQNYKPIRFVEVNGLYKKNANYDEANKVIDILLNEIKADASGHYPSVGVATFNIVQRNLILDRLMEEQHKSPENGHHIEQLYEAGLFIKNLENIQGDERDIIIISTTFGRREDGKFIQNFGPIGFPKGYRLLNVIITRAKYKVYLCCSIPPEYYNLFRDLIPQYGKVKRAIFYAYIAYCKAVENNDEETRQSILNLLSGDENSVNGRADGALTTESPFEEEVYQYLCDHINPKRIILQYKCAGFRIDMVVIPLTPGKPKIAIECDGASYHSSPEAYAWDMFRQKHLEEHGFKFIRIWSRNWWHDAEGETRGLVAFINENDGVLKSEPIRSASLLQEISV